MAEKFDSVTAAFYWENYSNEAFLEPIYALIDASNSLVDLVVDCDTTNLAKQFSSRFTTWSGLLDFASTIGVSFIKQASYDAGGAYQSKLWNAGHVFFNAETCPRTARALGEMFHYAVFFDIPDENYIDVLLTDIVN